MAGGETRGKDCPLRERTLPGTLVFTSSYKLKINSTLALNVFTVRLIIFLSLYFFNAVLNAEHTTIISFQSFYKNGRKDLVYIKVKTLFFSLQNYEKKIFLIKRVCLSASKPNVCSILTW